MFLALFGLLILAWIVSFLVLHISSGLIHLLLIFAVISVIIHFVSGRRSGA